MNTQKIHYGISSYSLIWIQLHNYYTLHKLDPHLAESNVQGLMHLVPFGMMRYAMNQPRIVYEDSRNWVFQHFNLYACPVEPEMLLTLLPLNTWIFGSWNILFYVYYMIDCQSKGYTCENRTAKRPENNPVLGSDVFVQTRSEPIS